MILSEVPLRLIRCWWRLRGGRTVKAFGEQIRFTADTTFPIRPLVCLPRGHYRSHIVRYADFVQLHCAYRLVSELTVSPVVVEIGAHHGAYAVILGKLVQRLGGTLIAVEPEPMAYEVLCENVRLNRLQDTVHCQQVAVLDRNGRMKFCERGSQSHLDVRDLGVGHSVEVVTLLVLVFLLLLLGLHA